MINCKDSVSQDKSRIENFCDRQTLAFYYITNGKDTCLMSGFIDALYYQLNIKIDESIFYEYIGEKVFNNGVITLSEDFYQEEEKYKITPNEKISNLYYEYGIDSLLKYLDKYPINKLAKDDMNAFDWSAYLLWQNNIYISLDHDVLWWYIDYDGYR